VNKPITKRVVDSLRAEEGGRIKLYDTKLTGFGVVAFASGKKSFFVEYGPSGRRRRYTLGQYGPLTVDQARDLARKALARVAAGGDPLDDRSLRRAMPSVQSFVDEYLEGVRLRKKEPRHDERYLDDIKARWGSRPLDGVTHRDVQIAMQDVAERGKTTANRWLASVRACLADAVRQKLLPANPAGDVRAFRENPPRHRTLSDAEMSRAISAIERLPIVERTALMLLVETGARKSEVLRARWEHIHLDHPDHPEWILPSPKADITQAIPITGGVAALLRALPRVGPYVIPGRDPSKPRFDLKRAWDAVRADAGLTGVTIHDLRRTFGLDAARTLGILYTSKLLRHTSVSVTQKVYAPIAADDMRRAAEELREARANVIPLRRSKA
jgi:integrase